MAEKVAIEDNKKNTKKLTLQITTPRGVKFVETADMLVMRCIDGDMGILPGHEAVSVILGDGILRLYNNGAEKKLAIFGGVASINDTTIQIFTTIAQLPEEIDLERAERDRKEAEAAIEEKTEHLQVQGSKMLLRRSLVRIEVSKFIKDTDYYGDDEDSN